MSESDRWEWCPSRSRTTARVRRRWSTAGRNMLLNHSRKLSDSIHLLLLTPYKVPAGLLMVQRREVDSLIQNVWRLPHTIRRTSSKDCYVCSPSPSLHLSHEPLMSHTYPGLSVRLLQCRIQSHLHSRVDWQGDALPATSPPLGRTPSAWTNCQWILIPVHVAIQFNCIIMWFSQYYLPLDMHPGLFGVADALVFSG